MRAKFSGDVGVCLATSGPGAIHLLNGLYDAKLDHQPVVAIVGQQASISLGAHYQQEVDLVSLFKDVASEYVRWRQPAQVTHLIDRAVQIARATRSVTCMILPDGRPGGAGGEAPPREHGAVFSAGLPKRHASVPRATCAGGRGPQRRREGGDPRRPGRVGPPTRSSR